MKTWKTSRKSIVPYNQKQLNGWRFFHQLNVFSLFFPPESQPWICFFNRRRSFACLKSMKNEFPQGRGNSIREFFQSWLTLSPADVGPFIHYSTQRKIRLKINADQWKLFSYKQIEEFFSQFLLSGRSFREHLKHHAMLWVEYFSRNVSRLCVCCERLRKAHFEIFPLEL